LVFIAVFIYTKDFIYTLLFKTNSLNKLQSKQ